MAIKICDRCGEKYEHRIGDTINDHGFAFLEVDALGRCMVKRTNILCPTCGEKLDKWFKERKDKDGDGN